MGVQRGGKWFRSLSQQRGVCPLWPKARAESPPGLFLLNRRKRLHGSGSSCEANRGAPRRALPLTTPDFSSLKCSGNRRNPKADIFFRFSPFHCRHISSMRNSAYLLRANQSGPCAGAGPCLMSFCSRNQQQHARPCSPLSAPLGSGVLQPPAIARKLRLSFPEPEKAPKQTRRRAALPLQIRPLIAGTPGTFFPQISKLFK